MDNTILKLADLDEKHTDQAIALFVEGFYNIFSKAVTKDKNVLHELFKDSFDYQMIYVCLQDDCVAGFLGLGNSQKRPIKLKKETCQKLFGKAQGVIIYRQMGSMLEKTTVHNEKEGYIDYLTTAVQFRGMGIATRLLQYIFDNLAYESYTLEALSKNINAIKLYEKIGFKQIKTSMNLMTMLSGFGKPIIMRISVDQSH